MWAIRLLVVPALHCLAFFPGSFWSPVDPMSPDSNSIADAGQTQQDKPLLYDDYDALYNELYGHYDNNGVDDDPPLPSRRPRQLAEEPRPPSISPEPSFTFPTPVQQRSRPPGPPQIRPPRPLKTIDALPQEGKSIFDLDRDLDRSVRNGQSRVPASPPAWTRTTRGSRPPLSVRNLPTVTDGYGGPRLPSPAPVTNGYGGPRLLPQPVASSGYKSGWSLGGSQVTRAPLSFSKLQASGWKQPNPWAVNAKYGRDSGQSVYHMNMANNKNDDDNNANNNANANNNNNNQNNNNNNNYNNNNQNNNNNYNNNNQNNNNNNHNNNNQNNNNNNNYNNNNQNNNNNNHNNNNNQNNNNNANTNQLSYPTAVTAAPGGRVDPGWTGQQLAQSQFYSRSKAANYAKQHQSASASDQIFGPAVVNPGPETGASHGAGSSNAGNGLGSQSQPSGYGGLAAPAPHFNGSAFVAPLPTYVGTATTPGYSGYVPGNPVPGGSAYVAPLPAPAPDTDIVKPNVNKKEAGSGYGQSIYQVVSTTVAPAPYSTPGPQQPQQYTTAGYNWFGNQLQQMSNSFDTNPQHSNNNQHNYVAPSNNNGYANGNGIQPPVIAPPNIGGNGYGGGNGAVGSFPAGQYTPPGNDCFEPMPNCLVVNTVPLERLLQITANQCKRECEMAAERFNGRQCIGAVHVPLYMTCYLYDYTGKNDDKIVGAFGYNFYRLNLKCQESRMPAQLPTPKPNLRSRAIGSDSHETHDSHEHEDDSHESHEAPPTTTSTARPSTRAAAQTRTTEWVTKSPTTQHTNDAATSTNSPRLSTRQLDTCSGDARVILQRAEGWQLFGSDGHSSSDISEADCAAACVANTTPEQSAVYACVSFDYDVPSRTCVLSTEAAVPLRNGVLNKNPNSVYYEKLCIKSEYVDRCDGAELDRQSQHLLVESGETVETVDGLADCVNLCFDALPTFGFNCKSVLYFPEERDLNCLLNSESRQSRPDVYVEEPTNRVEYVGVDDCAVTSRRLAVNNFFSAQEPQRSVRLDGGNPLKVRQPLNNDQPTSGRGRIPDWLVEKRNQMKKRTQQLSERLQKPDASPLPPAPVSWLATTTPATTRLTVTKSDAKSLWARKLLKTINENSLVGSSSNPLRLDTKITRMNVRPVGQSQRQQKFNRRIPGLSVSWIEWGEWSSCSAGRFGKRVRYRKCTPSGPSNCEKQQEWCNTQPTQTNKPLDLFKSGTILPSVTLPPVTEPPAPAPAPFNFFAPAAARRPNYFEDRVSDIKRLSPVRQEEPKPKFNSWLLDWRNALAPTTTTSAPTIVHLGDQISGLFNDIVDGTAEMIKRMPKKTSPTTQPVQLDSWWNDAVDSDEEKEEDKESSSTTTTSTTTTTEAPTTTTTTTTARPKLQLSADTTKNIVKSVFGGITNSIFGRNNGQQQKQPLRSLFDQFKGWNLPRQQQVQRNAFWSSVTTTTPPPPAFIQQEQQFRLPVVSNVIESLSSKIGHWGRGLHKQGLTKPTITKVNMGGQPNNNYFYTNDRQRTTSLTMGTPTHNYFYSNAARAQPKTMARYSSARRKALTAAQNIGGAQNYWTYTNSRVRSQPLTLKPTNVSRDSVDRTEAHRSLLERIKALKYKIADARSFYPATTTTAKPAAKTFWDWKRFSKKLKDEGSVEADDSSGEKQDESSSKSDDSGAADVSRVTQPPTVSSTTAAAAASTTRLPFTRYRLDKWTALRNRLKAAAKSTSTTTTSPVSAEDDDETSAEQHQSAPEVGKCLPLNGSCKIGVLHTAAGTKKYCMNVQHPRCKLEKMFQAKKVKAM